MQVFDFEVQVGEGLTIGGLGVFPLTGRQIEGPPYLTGPEAFEGGLIEVGELDPPEVAFLAITNLAEVPILLVEGEMLVGGDQNRTMNVTVLCPPQARTVVPVSCVEAGRWGARRAMSASKRHAPGSIRAAKTANLEPRTSDRIGRRSDQARVWRDVECQALAHSVDSDTFALDDIQNEVEDRIASQLDQVRPVADQIGVICAIGDRVVGMDLFDRPSTLEKYLRGIIAGHVLDASPSSSSDSLGAIERFLAQVDATPRSSGQGVGLGEEILLRGGIAGIGLSYGQRAVHLAAFPAPE